MHSMTANNQRRPQRSTAGLPDPGHQPCVQGQQQAVPCDVTAAPAAAVASQGVPTDHLGMCPAASQQFEDPPARSAVQLAVERLPTAAVSETGLDTVKPGSTEGSLAEPASLCTSPVKPVKAAPLRRSKPGRASADVPSYPAQLAPVTPAKHEATSQLGSDLPAPTAALGRRRAACRSQPVDTRRTSAYGTAQSEQMASAAAEQEPQVPRQEGRRQHAPLGSARDSAVADKKPPASRPQQSASCKASAANAAQLLPDRANPPANAIRQKDAGRQALSEKGQQPGAKPVRVAANRELARLLAAQPTLELSSLLTCGVNTRRQCTQDPPDAGNSGGSHQAAAAKSADRTEPRTPSRRSKRWRDSHSVLLRAAPAQPSKKQRIESHPAAGLAAGPSGTPASIAAGAVRLRRKQADSTSSVRSRLSARPERGRHMVEPLEHRAATHPKPSAASPDTAIAARNSTTAADIGAGPNGGRRTRSQAKACDADAALPAPGLLTTGLPLASQMAMPRHGIETHSSRRSAAVSTEPSSNAATAATPGRAQRQHRGTRGNSRGAAARGSAASGQVTAAHSPATGCEADAVPPKRVVMKRELALLLRGSGSGNSSSGRRADELPAGLALRNRCVMGRTTVPARPAAAHAAQQTDEGTQTHCAANTSSVVASPQQDYSAAAAEHVKIEHHQGGTLCDSLMADAACAGVALADAEKTTPAVLVDTVESQQPENPPASRPKRPEAPGMQKTGTHGPEPGHPAAVVSSDGLVPGATEAASASQPTSMPTEPRQASSMQAEQRPMPLLPAPPKWGGRGRRSMDVAAAEATARGRTVRAVRPDYARLAATEAAATRLPVWPGPQIQVLIQVWMENDTLTQIA